MKPLSIIVPVYRVEKYIRSCVESIFRQGLPDSDFEVILVNDGTPDNSMDIIQDIINAHQNIIVINQQNHGLSVARNNGMKRASGEYILFVDSDDLLIDNSLSAILDYAVRSKADLVVADFLKMDDEKLRNHTVNIPVATRSGETESKSGHELLLEQNPRHFYVWRTLHNRSFLSENHISFIPGIFFEDNPFTHECYLKADKCLRVHIPIYIYRVGHPSITSSINKAKGMDFATAIAKTWELSKMDGLTHNIRLKVQNNAFELFSVLVYGLSHEMKNPAERIAILEHFKKTAPDLQFTNSTKQRLVNYGFQRIPRTYMALRVIYGLAFEKFVHQWKKRKKSV